MDPLEGQMANTPRLDPVSTKRQRIAELARDAPEMVFTSLAHHIDMHVLRTAYAATRKDGAVGLDGQTAADYAVHLEANLQSLLGRNLTPTGCGTCCRNASGALVSRCTRRRVVWSRSADRDVVGARGRTVTDSRLYPSFPTNELR